MVGRQWLRYIISSPEGYSSRYELKQCRVYRVRTKGYTVRYNHWGPRPHTRGLIPYSIDLSQIENIIIIIYLHRCVEGGNVYHILSIHSFLLIHWFIIYVNIFLLNYSFISYYHNPIRRRHSFTPLLTQTHEIESRKYITKPDVYRCIDLWRCMCRN